MQQGEKRIAKNSILLFIRMGILMVINILSVRFVRAALGVEEYGVFTAIVGIAQMMVCLNTVLSISSQRYFSIALGNENKQELNDCFQVSVRFSWMLAGGLLFVFETIGLWFVCTRMQYPPERMDAVIISYQAALFTILSLLVQVPYLAAVMAHEKMGVFAYISILEGVLKLVLAIGLLWCSTDLLIIYSGGLCLFSIFSTVLYAIYCHRHFEEISLPFHTRVLNSSLYREMITFGGWTLFGGLAGMLMAQGNLILLNVYHGPAVNAAYAIGMQVYSAFIQLGNNVFMAVRPQMIMSYSQGNLTYLNKLTIRSSQLVILLLVMLSIPFIWWMPEVLHVWLGDADPLTSSMCKLMIVNALIQIMNIPLTTIMQATNRVKEYHIVVETLTLLCFPLSWILMQKGMAPETMIWSMIGVLGIVHVIRVERVVKYYKDFCLRQYIVQFLLPTILIVSGLCYMI